MSLANIYYHTKDNKAPTAKIEGEVIEVTDRWVSIVPDDKSVCKMIIPYAHVISIEFLPYPEDCRVTDKEAISE